MTTTSPVADNPAPDADVIVASGGLAGSINATPWAFRCVGWRLSVAVQPRAAQAWWRRRSLVHDRGAALGGNVPGACFR